MGAFGEPRGHHEDGVIRVEDAELAGHAGEEPLRIPGGKGGLGLHEEVRRSPLGCLDTDEGVDDPWGPRGVLRGHRLARGIDLPVGGEVAPEPGNGLIYEGVFL